MGEFEDETVAEPAEAEPAAQPQPEPGPEQAEAQVQPADVPAADDDPIAAIQDGLLFEEPALTPAADELVEDSPAPDAPAPSEFDDFVTAAAADITDTAPGAGDTLPASEPGSASDIADIAVAPELADAETSDDDLAAAIAASNEQVGTEATLDDIAPGTTHDVPAEEILSEEALRYGAPWWPFLVYLGLWIAFAGLAVWQFDMLAQGTVLYETQQYTLFVFGGLVLAAAGVILIPAVWLGARLSPKRHRAGLFTSAFIKGAVFVLIGVVVWWGTFMALDYLRLGRLL